MLKIYDGVDLFLMLILGFGIGMLIFVSYLGVIPTQKQTIRHFVDSGNTKICMKQKGENLKRCSEYYIADITK